MGELARMLLLLGLAGTVVTFLGSFGIWWMDEDRRIRRALRRVLKAEPDSVLVAKGRGRGAGFSFDSGLAAVAWDRGAWCLVYRIDELMGAELLIDGQVAARAYRGEPRRALEQRVASAGQVTLRLIFDDPRNPDFELDLWLSGDELRREASSPAAAIQEANRWLARTEAVLRRPAAPPPVVARPAPAVAPSPPPPEDERPPWEDPDDYEDDDGERIN
jgi:hypothetical protein